MEPDPHRADGSAQQLGDFGERPSFEMEEHDGAALPLRQFAERGIELVGECIVDVVSGHGGSLQLMAFADLAGFAHIACEIDGDAVQPRCQGPGRIDACRLPGQDHEHRLGGILGIVRIAEDALAGAEHQGRMACDQGGECPLVTAGAEAPQQVLVVVVHVLPSLPIATPGILQPFGLPAARMPLDRHMLHHPDPVRTRRP